MKNPAGKSPLGEKTGCLTSRTLGTLIIRVSSRLALPAAAVWLTFLLAGCTAPIGADRVTTRQAYDQVVANALRSGKPSAHTVAILHRYDLDRLAAEHPDEAVRQLHQKAVTTGERDLLFALAELSYVAGDQIRRSVKPWDPRDPRDFYLGSAVYAWLFLFGESSHPGPTAFDRRFREACDLYNYGLGLGLVQDKNTNGIVQLESARRALPVGEIQLQINSETFASRLGEFEQILLADQFRVRGLSMRNREAGIGTPLICVRPLNSEFGLRQTTPATALLRGPASLGELADGKHVCALELYHPIFDSTTAVVGGVKVPLEMDITTFRAYALSQSHIWSLGKLGFLAPAERIPSQLLLNQPFEPDRIPVVFVHGTFSSPVTWAEMINTLIADPEIRKRYQFWTFIYGSGNPLVQSIGDFRAALMDKVQQLDPQGTNALLRQMVIIGHSQGGLLTKCVAVDAGDRLWRVFSTNRLEDLKISQADREKLHQALYLTPLPFVSRVVFIATPHRGSYLSSGFARRLAARLVSLPGNLVTRSKDMFQVMAGSDAGKFLQGRMPTSLDGMSPKNPGLLAIADLPVVPQVKVNSIVAIDGNDQPPKGSDGVVKYTSAHVDYAESELIVRSYHTCLDNPATIEEVRRILRKQLNELPPSISPSVSAGDPKPTALSK